MVGKRFLMALPTKQSLKSGDLGEKEAATQIALYLLQVALAHMRTKQLTSQPANVTTFMLGILGAVIHHQMEAIL
jgi:hypothetical protein